ncbi:MAG: N-acetylgalactosamine-N,N'-diacetylbacillosaminyl-diphospho-undecaprenol 4-alpha-N-acetylgalactosaminyltransferase [Candidatus Erwinia impunctatus]|nr:N-acetylgalactosamine-N,N'-diacetylbacillosaminyl-diphospho-undecaprenol 4-alpha-N-acetylgalactosaminyltransferase [Culicoides impunctatus]
MQSPRKKILLLDTGNEWGGGTNSMLELLRRIDRQRFDICCCFYHNYRQGEGETIEQVLNSIAIPVIFLAQRRQPRWAGFLKECLRDVVFFSRPLRRRITVFVDTLWRIKLNAQRIRHLLQQQQFDILYMNNQPASNEEGYRAAMGLPVSVVQHCRIEPVLDARIVNWVNRRADAIIAVSEGVKHALISHGVTAEKCTAVYNAIDINQPLPNRQQMRHELLDIDDDTFVFGSIGSLITRKAHHHTLQAIARFAAANPDAAWRLVILGEGPEMSALRQQAAESGIADRVIFTGFRNNPLAYLATFDVFILASKSEGLPRVILEAMLLKSAVIGSKVTGTAELITNNINGLLFNYGDVDTLYQQIQLLYHDQHKRQSLTEQANANVRQHYAIEHYVSGVETILQTVNHGNITHV